MAQFKEEKLIPLINVTRRLLSCDLEQQFYVLQKLARIFDSHQVSLSLMDIIVTGLFNPKILERIPRNMYKEIQSALPSDKQLNLKDSVYESRLVDEHEDQDEEGRLIKKKKKLPMTLLRIPSDLQCHLFQFLRSSDLMQIQKVCRALFFEARNPNALYSLKVYNKCSTMNQYIKECYSRPTTLSIFSSKPFIGNAKWGESVVDMTVSSSNTQPITLRNFVPFRKLQKCSVFVTLSPLLNGRIASYHTLRDLSLSGILLTEDVIDQIRKFQNLQHLSLRSISQSNANPPDDHLQHSDPISLPNLKTFSWTMERHDFRNLQRFLIGSSPNVVDITAGEISANNVEDIEIAIHKMVPIKEFKISNCDKTNDNPDILDAMNLWLRNAKSPIFKLLDAIDVYVDTAWDFSVTNPAISSIISILQHANTSKVTFECFPQTVSDPEVDDVIQNILQAPFGTFTELTFHNRFQLLGVFFRNGSDLYYFEYLFQSLDDEEDIERDNEIVKRVVMESIDAAEKWMEQWLVFNEAKMKQIGLQKLEIEFQFDLYPSYDCIDEVWNQNKQDRFEAIFNEIINEVINVKVERWTKYQRKDLRTSTDERQFTVTLSMCL